MGLFRTTVEKMDRSLSLIAIFLIHAYRYMISPILGQRCRFYPSCSEYAQEALEKRSCYGIVLILKRLARCHPFHAGGFDPVPIHNQLKKQ